MHSFLQDYELNDTATGTYFPNGGLLFDFGIPAYILVQSFLQNYALNDSLYGSAAVHNSVENMCILDIIL